MTNNIQQLHQQAQQALNQQQFKLAHQCLVQILQQDKNFADAYFLLAMIASAHHNRVKAIELINNALGLCPLNAEYLAQLAKHYALENQHVKAVHFAQLAGQQKPSSSLVLDTIGVAFSQVGQHQQAVIFFKQAVAITNNNPTFYFNLGASLKFNGDFKAAKAAYHKTLALAPNYYKAYFALSSLGGITKKNNHIPQLKMLLTATTQADDLLYIGHALAREYEALADYQQAFKKLKSIKHNKLKQLNQSTMGYDIEQDRQMFASLQRTFDNKTHGLSPGDDNNEAIFIVGMPRTGTTLVERILSQHSEVSTAGELQHFGLLLKKMSQSRSNRVIDQETIEGAKNIDFKQLGQAYIESTRAVTGKAAKFVDKMPLNVLYAGFILSALPNAKIICLDRNPLDSIVSNFRQLFAVNFSYYNYAYDLATTAEFYLLFKKLIALWQRQFPDSFYIVNYEKLVNNPQHEAKKMIEFCGLDWQENCIAIDKNSAPVATASAVQVRQPINNKSIGNWRKYESHLEQVKDILRQGGIDPEQLI